MEKRNVLCPACGAEMELKMENFSIRRTPGGGLAAMLSDLYDVDLYACPNCGKVELYTANFRKKEEEPEEEPEETEEPEPSEPQTGGGLFGFGKRKGKRPPWEN